MLSKASLVKKCALLYDGLMTVTEHQQVVDSTSHKTSYVDVDVLVDIPCRLSFSTTTQATEDDASEVRQIIKLFFNPSYTIKAGSKVTVTQNDVTTAYKHSGVESVYLGHKEIVLQLFERWA